MSAHDSTHDPIDARVEQDVAILTINRPDKLGALTQQMRVDLARLITEYGTGETVRGIVITGTGRAFSAGEDLQEAAVSKPEELITAMDAFHNITRAIIASKVPVIAAVNGLAVGGAAEVTMSCDARIGSEHAEFMLPENQIGLTISNASSLFLRRLVGTHAHRLILESPRIDATEATRIGLLDRTVDADALVAEAVAQARRWNAEGSASSLHLVLLRPSADEVEAAITRENEIAQRAWDEGILQAGVERFWSSTQ